MNTKQILFFSFLCLSLLLVSCSIEETVETEAAGDSELDEESALNLEDLEVNTESSNVERSTSHEIVIENMQFNPTDISVFVGDTVEWINLDSVSHTVTFEDARFDVVVPPGASVSYTFEALGVARYFCQFHPSMQGSVLVE